MSLTHDVTVEQGWQNYQTQSADETKEMRGWKSFRW